MVKESVYRHHPERMEKGLFIGSEQLDILGIHLMTLDAILDSGSLSTMGNWLPLKLAPLVVTAGEVIPADAIAVILDVAVNEFNPAAATDGLLQFAPPEFGDPFPTGHVETVYCGDEVDRINSRLVIVLLSTDFCILWKATASGANTLDYTLKLVGWLIGGTRVSTIVWPSAELLCKFVVAA